MLNAASLPQLVIIGSGVAGLAAAQAIRRADVRAEIQLISADPFGYYSRPGLAYLISGETSEDLLFPFSQKELQALNLRWVTERVASIQPSAHTVTLANRSVLKYDRLLIATGSQSVALDVPGMDLQGVFKLDHLGDARSILQYCRQAHTAVVTGGGITALELVEGLRCRGLSVHYLLRGDRYWSNVLDEVESRMVEARLSEEGIQIHFRANLAAIQGQKGRVASVQTREGQSIKCELVAAAIGVQPCKEIAQAAGLRVDRGILVDDTLRTSDADIFAAGDVAQVYDPLTGLSALDTLWNTAREQGHAAGLNMAGQAVRYHKSAPLNVTRLGGLTTTIIGMVGKGADPSLSGIGRGDSETWRQLPIHTVAETHDACNRLRLIVGEQRLLGAVIMGSQEVSIPLQELIAGQVDVNPIRPALLHSTHLSQIITSFWENWRASQHANPQP